MNEIAKEESIDVAKEESIDVSKVLGLLLTRCDDLSIKAIGRKILNGDIFEHKIEILLITALTIYCDCNLGNYLGKIKIVGSWPVSFIVQKSYCHSTVGLKNSRIRLDV